MLKNISARVLALGRWKLGAIAAAVIILAIGGYLVFGQSGNAHQFITVEKGSITETVSVTGNTAPIRSVSLSFGSTGIIARISSAIGKRVSTGAVLATLDTGDLYAQLKQAQANVSAQQAKLEGLQSGSRPEDIAAAQAALDKGAQDLTNLYGGVADAALDAYAKVGDVVNVQLSPMYENTDAATPPRLTFISGDPRKAEEASVARQRTGAELDTWQDKIANSSPASPESMQYLLSDSLAYLAHTRDLLNKTASALEDANLDATTLAGYKADVTASLATVNAASKSFNTISQNISSQKLAVSQLRAQLDLKRAGATAQDIAAQRAQVAQAQASADSVLAKLRNSQITAPQSGVITQFDAKVGQIASPGAALISIISDGAFEVDASVSEIDVGRLSVGNRVTMKLDAFPGEAFTGRLIYVDPAQTAAEGVVGYKIKVAFDTADPRMKSGLTANLEIETRHKDNVLTLPQYAILEKDEGAFVQIVENTTVRDVPVVLGISDDEGRVEVVSGVTEGQQVLNVGLRTQ